MNMKQRIKCDYLEGMRIAGYLDSYNLPLEKAFDLYDKYFVVGKNRPWDYKDIHNCKVFAIGFMIGMNYDDNKESD